MLRIATRESPLALWQARRVCQLLEAANPGLTTELVAMSTVADRDQESSIAEIGGKGLFAKEVQTAVLRDRADVAVHSAKDLPAITPPGLILAAVPSRGDCRDALVGAGIEQLSPGSVVGTGSNRRRVQMADLCPGVAFAELRGNMATRLDKAGSFHAIVVAAAALQRLGLADHITEILDPAVFIPQVGQGALGIECRSGDSATLALLATIDDPVTNREVTAERAFLVELGGDCTLPAGAHAITGEDGELTMSAILSNSEVVPSEDGLSRFERANLERVTLRGHDAVALGTEVAIRLRNRIEQFPDHP